MLRVKLLKKCWAGEPNDIVNIAGTGAYETIALGLGEAIDKLTKKDLEIIDTRKAKWKKVQEGNKALKNTQFSFFTGGIKAITPKKNIDLKDFIGLTKSDTYKNQIIKLRNIKDKDKQNLLKSKLDFCIPSGVFTTRDSGVLLLDKMKEASGVLSLDVDDYKGDYKKLKEVIKADEFVSAVFDSPRKKLKIFISVPPEIDNDLFWRRWFAACKFFGKRWKCEFDDLKDITRACFVSWDIDAYYNDNTTVFEGIADAEEFNRQIKPIDYSVLTKGIEKGNRNEALFSLGCSLMHKKVEPAYIEELLKTANQKNNPPLGESELQQIFNNVFKYKKETKEEKEIPPETQEEIIKLLEEPEVIIQYLDLGEAKGVWYNGFNLNGKEAVITSDGKILRNTLERFKDKVIGENQINELFEYNGYLGDIAPLIAKKTIKRFYTKANRNHLIKPKEIYKTVRDKILYFMDFKGKDEIADVLTCWIIDTYCYPLFYWFPHILFNAPSQSGKSKAGYIVTQLSFRGFDLGASAGVTPAQIFRTIEANRGTLFVDEFEIRQEGVANDTQQLVNQIINASPTKDAYVIRTEQINKKWKAWKFPIFCPKLVCNISGINPTSLSRFIGFKWLKGKSEKGKRKPFKEKEKNKFIPIREDLYILILENWKEIKEIHEKLDLKDLTNREEDNWLPLFAIAKFIDSSEGEIVNAEKQLQIYLNSYQELEIDTGDSTEDFLRLLYDLVAEEQKYYKPKEIAEWIDIANLLSYLKSPAHWIGKTLTLYKFKKNRGGGVRKYLLSKQSIKQIVDLYYGVEENDKKKDPEETPKNNGTEETPHNDTNDTQQHKQHKTTPKQVSLGGISAVMPELDTEKIEVETIDMSKDLPKYGKPLQDLGKLQREIEKNVAKK